MPKRKRYSHSDPKAAIIEKLAQGKKNLQRALKTAKGFERQKLGKRLKNAQSIGDAGRINREIEVLKGLDLAETAETYLYGKISKVKRFVESGLLPEEVNRAKKERDGLNDEEKTAIQNVTSGMFNMPVLKEAMAEVMRGLYLTLDVPLPDDLAGQAKRVAKKEDKKSIDLPLASKNIDSPKRDTRISEKGGEEEEEEEEISWYGFDADEDDAPGAANDGHGGEDMDSDDLARYDDMLGSSASESDSRFSEGDEESRANILPNRHQSSHATKQLSLSLSPSPSPSPPPPSKRPKTKSQPKSFTTGGNLPSLLNGYFSNSDSSASDLEDIAPKTRKNRPGQMARRAIFEKKFGDKANHIRTGQPRVAEMGKKGREKALRNENRKSRRARERREGGRATGENATKIGERKKDRDDVGILHPSWQAAKKAKEAKATAAFQGKKLTFD